MFVDTLTTNFNIDGVHKPVTDVIGPASGNTGLGRREGGVEVHTVDKITVTGDKATNFVSEVGGTHESLLDIFHGEVGVATVDHFEEGDLGISGEIDILCAVGH